MRDREMKELPESEITNPYFAAFITSFVRATMGEIMNALPRSTMVFSCTTDGFLTDANAAQIKKATGGPLSKIYSRQRKLLANDESVLEIKHRAKRLLGWRARGQATITPAPPEQPGGKAPPMPLAKGGIHLIDHYENDLLENKAIQDLFWHRTDETAFPVHSLAGVRQVVMFDIDSVPVLRTKSLNMEYDWKRRPYDAKDSTQFGHIAFSTLPWDRYEQFRMIRDVSENIKNPVIKNTDALDSMFSAVAAVDSLEKSRTKWARKKDKSLNIMMKTMTVVWHHDRQLLGRLPPKHSASQFAQNLTDAGCPCKRSDVENGKGTQSLGKFLPPTIPATPKTVEAFNYLKTIYPDIDPKLFLTSTAPADWLVIHKGGMVCPFIAKLN
jgi:hypothetical protein